MPFQPQSGWPDFGHRGDWSRNCDPDHIQTVSLQRETDSELRSDGGDAGSVLGVPVPHNRRDRVDDHLRAPAFAGHSVPVCGCQHSHDGPPSVV